MPDGNPFEYHLALSPALIYLSLGFGHLVLAFDDRPNVRYGLFGESRINKPAGRDERRQDSTECDGTYSQISWGRSPLLGAFWCARRRVRSERRPPRPSQGWD